ncbi:MAG: 8-oxo-dGTP diphosphatase MutT [Lysobacter sp.]
MTEQLPSRVVQVVAGIIRDVRGRILLARRTEGRDLAGLWEFPGGKIDAGESPEAALARELHEELGIRADIGAPLINVPQIYPDKRLSLDVRHIGQWTGTASGREGQALAWVPPHKLARYPMPPADRPVVAALQQPALYLVTPDVGAVATTPAAATSATERRYPPAGDDGSGDFSPDERRWLDALGRALAQGIRRVQLRAPTADPARWPALAAAAAARCAAAGAEVLINGDAALALALGTGLHLRADQLASHDTRPVAVGVPLAASCHTIEELCAAQAIGCDFAVVGSIRPTASHPGTAGIGWDCFARLREHVSLPLYAIGGLAPGDLPQARKCGAQGIAAIRALWPD